MTTESAIATRAVRLSFAALVLAMLPAVLDQTILATALPTIATDLGRLSDVSWLVTVYIVAATATTPLWASWATARGTSACCRSRSPASSPRRRCAARRRT